MGRRALSYPRALLRRAGVTVVATAAVVGVLGPSAGPASALPADEVVIGPYGQSIEPEHLLSVGRTGFLHVLPGAGRTRQWTDYTTGRTTTPDIPHDGSVQRVFNTHADTIAYQTGAGEAVLIDPVSGDKRTMRLPEGFNLQTVQGDTALGYVNNGECRLFRFAADGSLQGRPVTDLPDGAACGGTSTVSRDTGDGAGVVVQYRSSVERGFGVVDLATARFSTLPVPATSELELTPQAVAWFLPSSGFHVAPRTGPQGPSWSVPNPTSAGRTYRLVGSGVLWLSSGSGPVTAVTADGSTSQVLDTGYGAATHTVPGPDGSLLVVGKLGDHYAVHRFTEGADGSLQRAEVLDIPWHPSRTTSLALSQGRLATADTYVGGGAVYHEQKLALSGTPSVLTRENLGSAGTGECDATGCPLLYPTGDDRVLSQGVDSGGKAELRLFDKGRTAPGKRIATGLTGVSVESVSGRYVAYRTASATEVRDLDSGTVVRRTSTAPAALWGATLWQSAGAGKVTATDVGTGTVTRTVSLGTSCTPSSVQATTRYLYVECGSASARVVKLADGSVRSLGTGSAPGRLGDGFIVRVGADRQVTLTDLTPATPTTRVLGTARGTAAGRDWTVDPYGGHVAYVDAGGNVHVVRTGITTGALGVTDSSVPASARVALDASSFKPRWWLSKPVASWQLTLKNKVSGKTVRTLTGGEARGRIAASWDGWTGVTG
ncbi:MAG: hypothetical protein LBV60_05320, partial [Streptomyces sp.]|nr:hypothetical protein [Streptomyces sp.]